MNIAEKNRAERMVESWASNAKVTIQATTNHNIEGIAEPATVLAEQVKIERAIERLKDAGYGFNYGSRYGKPEGTFVTRSPNHPTVARIRKDADQETAAIAAKALTMITDIWGNDLEFDALAKLIA